MTATIWSPNDKYLAQSNATGTVKQEAQIAINGQIEFTLTTFAFVANTGSLLVFKNGDILTRTVDYTEVSNTEITLIIPAAAGDKVLFVGFTGIVGSTVTDTILRSDLNSYLGGTIVSTKLPEIGATVQTISEALEEVVSVKKFGAVGDSNTVDDTEAVIRAIATTNNGKPLHLIFPPAINGYKVGKVLIPSNVSIDLGGNLLIGTGDIGFETATWIDGVLTSNIGSTPESTLIINTRIYNGRMQNYSKAFNLQDFIWGSSVHDIEFIACGWSIYAQRCFFASFARLNSNGLLAGHTEGAYNFSAVNNLLELKQLTISAGSSRAYGFAVSGGSADCNIILELCGCEGMSNGIKFSGTINSLTMTAQNYFEGISNTAIDLSDATNKFGINIDSCWFYNVNKAVVGRFCLSGKWGVNNRIYTDASAPTPAIVDFNDTYSNNIIVEIPPLLNFGNITLNDELPSNYLIGPGCEIRYKRSIIGSGGFASVADIKTTSPIPFHYNGTGGLPDSGVIPFCTITYPAGTSGDITVDTWIPFSKHDMVGVSINVLDTSGLWPIAGIVINGNYSNMVSGGKSVTVSNNAGYIKLTLVNFNSTTSTYVATGVIRIL